LLLTLLIPRFADTARIHSRFNDKLLFRVQRRLVGVYPLKLLIVQATLIEIFRYSIDCLIFTDGEGSDDKILSLLEIFGSMAFGMFAATFL
jgi:hypothetical protein